MPGPLSSGASAVKIAVAHEHRGVNVMMNAQYLCVRVYYEDTDFSGRVYHASHLRFFERGRTEWMRAAGLQHTILAQTMDMTFAVTQLFVKFHAAGVIDDLLMVMTDFEAIKGPLLIFKQAVVRGEEKLATARVEVVTLKGNRPVRPPKQRLAALPGVKHRSLCRSAH